MRCFLKKKKKRRYLKKGTVLLNQNFLVFFYFFFTFVLPADAAGACARSWPVWTRLTVRLNSGSCLLFTHSRSFSIGRGRCWAKTAVSKLKYREINVINSIFSLSSLWSVFVFTFLCVTSKPNLCKWFDFNQIFWFYFNVTPMGAWFKDYVEQQQLLKPDERILMIKKNTWRIKCLSLCWRCFDFNILYNLYPDSWFQFCSE